MKQNQQPLTLETLGQLDDGTVRLLIEKAMQEAFTDCDNRPMLSKARKITIQLSAIPALDERHGAMKGIHLAVQVKSTLPPRQGREEYLRTTIIGDDGQAVFEITTVLNSLREAEFNTLEILSASLRSLLWDDAVLLHGKPD